MKSDVNSRILRCQNNLALRKIINWISTNNLRHWVGFLQPHPCPRRHSQFALPASQFFWKARTLTVMSAKDS